MKKRFNRGFNQLSGCEMKSQKVSVRREKRLSDRSFSVLKRVENS